jgi:2-polyprenyl-3-methyl-5-hydroxy-6-metoxy-1,4-benzoquinol methylase
MKLRNSIYFTPYDILEKNKISFADFAKKKNYYNQLAFLFESISARKIHTKKEIDFIIRVISQYAVNTESILDIACGVGRHARSLSAKGFKVTGIDQSSKLLKIAKKIDGKTRYLKRDIRDFNFAKKFDFMYCMWDAYIYLSQPQDLVDFFQCCYKNLNKDGILVLESTNYWGRPARPEISGKKFKHKDYYIDAFVKKQTNIKDRVHESIFVHLLINKKDDSYSAILDQELVRVYSPKELREVYKKYFKKIDLLGDINLQSKYVKNKAKRMIFVLKKII